MKKTVKYIAIGIVTAIILTFIGFIIWSQQTYKPLKEIDSLVGKVKKNVEHDWVTFTPTNKNNIGIILYPGAKVDPKAYSYYAKQLANHGYTVVVPQVTLNFAFLDVDKAHEIMSVFRTIKKWYVGGHSLGGVAASTYAFNHKQKVAGLIFLGSYPSDDNNYSKTNFPILSVYAQYDGLTTIQKIKETKHLLSRNTTMYEVKGGNHAQFGMYGSQKGDKQATISAKKQQDEIVQITTNWIAEQAHTTK